MKLKFIVFLMVIIVSLSAQITGPLEINGFFSGKQSSGQRAYQIVDGIKYMTYQLFNNIYFTKVTEGNIQTHTIIDTLDIWYDSFTDSAIQVLENGNIIIVYSEIESCDLGYLKIATSTDNGASFSVVTFEIIDFGDPHIVRQLVLSLYIVLLGVVVVYGGHRYVLLYIYYRHRRKQRDKRARIEKETVDCGRHERERKQIRPQHAKQRVLRKNQQPVKTVSRIEQ